MEDLSSQKTPKETIQQPSGHFRHPFTLPLARKLHIVTAGTLFIFNSAFSSSLPSGAHDALAAYFHLPGDSLKLVLPNSLYMVGFALGPLIFGPLSEHVGRKPVLVGTYFGYLVFTMACALAPNFPALLVFRLLCGLNAASPNAVLGGLYADIFESPQTRGTALAIFMVVTAFGPQLAPLVSGFISEISWRWTFWVGLAAGGAGFPVMALIPETYAPVLKKRAAKREAKHSKACAASTALKHSGSSTGFMVIFTRPFVMTAKEPVLLFSSLFMGFTYAIFYLYFQAYPIVFQKLYGLSPGVAGLAFLPISVGAVFAFSLFMLYTSYHTKAVAANKEWASVEEYRRLPLAAVGAPLLPIALFWLGWSAKLSIHPIMPIMSGLWFGMGYILIFMAMINYLTDAYKQYSASAQAAASTMRSTFAVCLPLATNSMYGQLGINWATSLLAFISMALAVIPFVFIRYGEWIRSKSSFSQRILKGEMVDDHKEENPV
ncbi:hypothetical protein N7492_005041 [Penicillium capsulatum]|uniref:Major facilitator superfamily (MFS) profile domain-containing protein n=1 Tax=Penicillium capsulatum TaxID=69766 RepID=A0A9W9LRR4_9EURO|nr:hypothetical protein N7492_005041 [Penicillium capsulatum]KAJ6135851.1 hypothetical protein N7512_001011 [Penicillium capsulatum]